MLDLMRDKYETIEAWVASANASQAMEEIAVGYCWWEGASAAHDAKWFALERAAVMLAQGGCPA